MVSSSVKANVSTIAMAYSRGASPAQFAPTRVPHIERDRTVCPLDATRILDVITKMAAEVCNAPMAAISLTHENRLLRWSHFGLPHLASPGFEAGFCNHPVSQCDFVEVEDATIDERFSNHPPVAGAPHIRYYVGVPVRNESGLAAAVLWVMDIRPKRLSLAQRKMFERLALTAAGV